MAKDATEKLMQRNEIWAIGFIILLLTIGAIGLYHSDSVKHPKLYGLIGTVLTGIGCSLIAAVAIKTLMFESLKAEIAKERHVDVLRSVLNDSIEPVITEIAKERDVDFMRTSLRGLSVDGIILKPKTNFDFAIRMVKNALEMGDVITEGNLTSDEYFLNSGNGEQKNYNSEITKIIKSLCERGKGDNLKRFHKVYRSLKVEYKSKVDLAKKQEKFNSIIKEWQTLGIQIIKHASLCTDFLLISDIDYNPKEALVGVFFDEDCTNELTGQTHGWLALHVTSGDALMKVHCLAQRYRETTP